MDIYVKYTAPKPPSGRPNIQFFADSGCTRSFDPDPIPAGDSVTYTLNPGTGSSFDFVAITFWAKDDQGAASQVARSFQQFKGGSANFGGKEYISDIDAHSKGTISFTVTNQNDQTQSGYVSFQVTIEDKSLKNLYTSQDPQIELPKNQGP